uniref:non-specific serine/threonine protein kinase n=1 Tax=Sciurus vulgaris TaxID=55149 RepID=A0A8D2DPF8_SCIVU
MIASRCEWALSTSALTDHYCVLRPIGEGSFSQVVLARHLLTGVKVAVKVVPKTEGQEPVLREREWLMSLEHQNIIQLFQVIETARNMYLVMEYAPGGQLRLRIPREGGLPEVKVRRDSPPPLPARDLRDFSPGRLLLSRSSLPSQRCFLINICFPQMCNTMDVPMTSLKRKTGLK